MRTREELLELSTLSASQETTEMGKRVYQGCLNSLKVRGQPYYGQLRHKYPQHWTAYYYMWIANYPEQGGLEIDQAFYPRGVESFVDFILYMGDVPEGMERPTRGRIDHSVGYLKGNFKWEAWEDNIDEMHSRRTPESYTNFIEGSYSHLKKRDLKQWIIDNKGTGKHFISDINKELEYASNAHLARGFRRQGILVITLYGSGDYTIEI